MLDHAERLLQVNTSVSIVNILVEPMLVKCWTGVRDGGPAPNLHLSDVICLLGTLLFEIYLTR